MTAVVVRPAVGSDIPQINAIYNEYIVDSHVSFDTEPWTDEERRAWVEDRSANGYPVFVAERDGAVVGTAWSGPWRDKAAYRGAVETTVVLAPRESGAGIGSMLYTKLLAELRGAGFHTAIAIIALPNEASIALHRKLGYRDVGVLDEVGHKDGSFYGTMLMQRELTAAD